MDLLSKRALQILNENKIKRNKKCITNKALENLENIIQDTILTFLNKVQKQVNKALEKDLTHIAAIRAQIAFVVGFQFF